MELKISGLDQVQRRLREAPNTLVAKSFAKALDRAGGVIAAEVERRTPIGPEGDLKEHVIVKVEVDTAARGGSALIGFSSATSGRTGKPMDLIAYWVEYGHRLVGHGKRKKDRKDLGKVPPHPFMRPAFDASADRAVEVFGDTLIDSLSDVEHS